jgi:predicted alpha/beta-hydrolase family hydrolase
LRLSALDMGRRSGESSRFPVAGPATFAVDAAGERTSATVYAAVAPSEPRTTLVLAHGAGGRQTHPWMVAMAKALVERGLDVVTFDFLYTHARRRLPDRNEILEATWRAVLAAVRARDERGARLFAGGKSMGGRIATQVAADWDGPAEKVDGLVSFGYPLHPPGRPDKLRVAHLPKVKAPALFVQGSRDAFGTPEELRPFVDEMPSGARVYVVDGGDHSLVLPKSAGQRPEDVVARVADEVVLFTAPR